MENLLKNQKSLVISSIDKDGMPDVSYAPFVMIDNKIYLYLSEVANHYYNLRDNHKCSVMIIQDENECKTMFARNRLSFSCDAHMLENVDDKIFAKFDEVHDAKMMETFKKLDFHMFELNINQGRLVKGFGQAFEVTFENGEPKYVQLTGVDKKN